MSETKTSLVPKALQSYYEAVVEITDRICTEHLSHEYASMARELAATLSRKRPSPILKGKATTWACAIVYALGRVNFLFDKAQSLHVPAARLCEIFGVSNGTASAKAKQISDLLGITVMDPRWTVPSMLEKNPLVWMIRVNGLIIDARHASLPIQEEAFRLGLIPFIPGERQEP